MANIVQMYRLPSSQASTYVGPVGQLVVDTGTNAIRVQDGVTPGGAYTLVASANLSDLTDKAAARSALQLLSAALHDATDFDVAGAAVAIGNLCLKLAQNLNDLPDKVQSRINLGVAIGTNVQAFNNNLTALSGLTGAADQSPYFTGAGAMAITAFTATGRAIVGSATAAAARTTLGLGSAAVQNIGNSGANVPLLNANGGVNIWTGLTIFSGPKSLKYDPDSSQSHPIMYLQTSGVADTAHTGKIDFGTGGPATLDYGEIWLQIAP